MNEQTAVIIGASGLIGSHLVQQMLNDPYYKRIRLLVRKQLDHDHPKIEQQLVDFNNKEDIAAKLGTGDSIFCCIGTTQQKVKGDKVAYEKIDHDIPVHVAEAGIRNGFKKFLLVSSAGAAPDSSNFYLSIKGRTENDIKPFPFESISIFRPSMLLGKRNENRPAERAGQLVMQALSFIFIGSLKKYHPVKAVDVAKAMIAESKRSDKGIHLIDYAGMMKLNS